MATVKDQLTLAQAFVRALQLEPAQKKTLRLIMVGDGPLRTQAQSLLQAAGVSELCWLPGTRNDVADVLRGLDCFVLPSLAEGVSNTILEAMATGLPVIATNVGGNRELVQPGITGELVAPSDPMRLAQQILAYAHQREQSTRAGRAGRALVERTFSLDAMVERYLAIYEQQLGYSPGGATRVSVT